MAISQERTRDVTDTFEGFEENNFSVDVNDKTFRVLLDTLYTNKIRAVIRELWTNGFDSHIMAGCAAKPFLCSLPNPSSPTFMVRDYGTSLTHEEVMELYTTVFRSTKEQTNAQVGQLGLGSKSPFCYTDAFTVAAYLDGQKRTYLAHMRKDGVPTIKHLTTEPTTEPQGFEVSFPVQQIHFQEFVTEAENVLRGFDVPPTIEGADVHVPEPKFAHNNWKIYPSGQSRSYGRNNPGGMPNAVRQGCVIYPLTENQLNVNTGLSYEYTLVVDVPIGTVEHTANREALSLDDNTKAAVLQAFSDAVADITKYIEAQIQKDSKSLLEAEKAYFHWQRMLGGGGRRAMQYKGQDLKGYIALPTSNPLTPEKILDYKEKQVEPWKDHLGKLPTEYRWSVQLLANEGIHNEAPVFVFDSGDRTIPRRRLRFREWRKAKYGAYGGSNVWIVVGATAAQRKYMKETLELKPEQLINVEDLPDPGPPIKTASAAPQERSGVYLVRGQQMKRLVAGDTIPTDYTWVQIDKQQASEYVRVEHIGGCTQERIGQDLEHFKVDSGESRDFLMLTERAVKRLAPKPEDELGTWMKSVVDRKRAQMFLRVKAQHIAAMIKTSAVPGLNVYTDEATALWTLMTDGLGFDFKSLAFDRNADLFKMRSGRYTNDLLGNDITRAITEAETYFNTLSQKYPLLFGDADAKFLKSYIQQKKGATTNP